MAPEFQGQMLRFHLNPFIKRTAWKSWMRDLQHLINVPKRKGDDSFQTGTRNGENRILQSNTNSWPWGDGELATPTLPLPHWLWTAVDSVVIHIYTSSLCSAASTLPFPLWLLWNKLELQMVCHHIAQSCYSRNSGWVSVLEFWRPWDFMFPLSGNLQVYGFLV